MISSAKGQFPKREYAEQGLSDRIPSPCFSCGTCRKFHMTSYVLLKIFHVLIAILGLGQVGALFVMAWQKTVAMPLTLRIARIVTISLLLMLLSGIGLLK